MILYLLRAWKKRESTGGALQTIVKYKKKPGQKKRREKPGESQKGVILTRKQEPGAFGRMSGRRSFDWETKAGRKNV